MTTLRIATRRSALALAQAEEIATLLSASAFRSEIVPMSTSGDEGATSAESPTGMKGLWVDRIVEALRTGEVDIAVHSAKDLPADDEEGIVIGAVPKRADPLDILIGRDERLQPGMVVGTSSIRRRAQLLAGFPGMGVTEIRGNVDTRLRKLAEGEVDGLVLAAAGLARLGVDPPHARRLRVDEMVPAPGQGCLAVQVREDDRTTRAVVSVMDHLGSRRALEAERTLVQLLGRRMRPSARGARGREGRPDQDGGPRRHGRRCEGHPHGGREHGPGRGRVDPRGTAARRGRGQDPGGAAGVKRTLAGRTILVTRPAEQAAPLVRELERRGARVLVAPTIRLMPARSAALTAALKELAAGRFDWITLTSAATVEVLRERLASPRDVRAKVAVIGEGTAAAFRRWARRDPTCSRRPSRPRPSLGRSRAASGRVLCARADIAPEGLEAALERKGWEAVRVDAYRTVFATSLPREARDALPPGGRRCRDVHERLHGPRLRQRARRREGRRPKVVCIGPVTAAAARAARPATRRGCEAAHDRGPRRGPRAGAAPSGGS